MAWIDLTGLGKYHDNIKAWIDKIKYVHPANHPATMIIQDSNNQFVTKEQKEKWNNKLDSNITSIEIELEKNINIIPIDKELKTINEDSKLWLFVDGIKLIKNKHYIINSADNTVVLNEAYLTTTNVEIIIF